MFASVTIPLTRAEVETRKFFVIVDHEEDYEGCMQMGNFSCVASLPTHETNGDCLYPFSYLSNNGMHVQDRDPHRFWNQVDRNARTYTDHMLKLCDFYGLDPEKMLVDVFYERIPVNAPEYMYNALPYEERTEEGIAQRSVTCKCFRASAVPREIALQFVKDGLTTFNYCSKQHRDDEEILMQSLRDCAYFRHASKRLRNNKGVVEKMVLADVSSFQYATSKRKHDVGFVVRLVKQKRNTAWINLVPEELMDSGRVVLELATLVRKSDIGVLMRRVSSRLQANQSFVKQCVAAAAAVE